MKMLTIEVVEALGNNQFWVTGRCCEDDICIGDVLWSNDSSDASILVKAIEVYGKRQEILYHGYVGGVIVEVLTGGRPPNAGYFYSHSINNFTEKMANPIGFSRTERIKKMKRRFLESKEYKVLLEQTTLHLDKANLWQLEFFHEEDPKKEKLFAKHSGLKKIPKKLFLFKALKFLSLDSNQLTELPSEFKNLEALETLSLNKNQFCNFPKVIFDLPSLERLYFSDNQLKSIPPSLGRMGQLKTLALSGNPIKSLPDSFIGLNNLERLVLDRTHLSEFPLQVLSIKRIRHISLKGTIVKTVPEKVYQSFPDLIVDLESH